MDEQTPYKGKQDPDHFNPNHSNDKQGKADYGYRRSSPYEGPAALKYRVILVRPVDGTMLRQSLIPISTHFKLSIKKATLLLLKEPGPLTRAISKEQALKVYYVMKAENLPVVLLSEEKYLSLVRRGSLINATQQTLSLKPDAFPTQAPFLSQVVHKAESKPDIVQKSFLGSVSPLERSSLQKSAKAPKITQLVFLGLSTFIITFLCLLLALTEL